MVLVLEQVLDLNGHVVRYGRKFPMKRPDKIHRVTNAIKEIRITEGNMLRAGGHLAANVFEHHVAANNSKDPFVDGNDGAVAAKMLATAARFCRTNDAKAISGNDEMRVLLYRGHSGSIRDFELKAGHGDHGVR